MSNEGAFELGLLDVAGNPVGDPDVSARFFSVPQGGTVRHFRHLNLAADSLTSFRLPAFPQVRRMDCAVSPSRFQTRRTESFMLTDGGTVRRQIKVMRKHKLWSADFDRWADLPAQADALKTVLENSPRVVARGGEVLGRIAGSAYDDLKDALLVNAKATLLNLYAKLSEPKPPTDSKPNWFSYVVDVLEIGRERFVAIVDPAMETAVRDIRERISDFPEYKRTPAANHLKNFPERYSLRADDLVSVKTSEDHGNLQLTVGTGTDPETGKPVTLLDTDIDENGKLLAHLVDVLILHPLKGGTHPFVVHEFLRLSSPTRPLGYHLV